MNSNEINCQLSLNFHGVTFFDEDCLAHFLTKHVCSYWINRNWLKRHYLAICLEMAAVRRARRPRRSYWRKQEEWSANRNPDFSPRAEPWIWNSAQSNWTPSISSELFRHLMPRFKCKKLQFHFRTVVRCHWIDCNGITITGYNQLMHRENAHRMHSKRYLLKSFFCSPKVPKPSCESVLFIPIEWSLPCCRATCITDHNIIHTVCLYLSLHTAYNHVMRMVMW